jgi:biopolymer transport protein ExbD
MASVVNIRAMALEEPQSFFTSMIDIVFLLLIFFMCATRFRQVEQRLDAFLPKDEGQMNVPVEQMKKPDEIRILIKDNITARQSDSFNVRAMRAATFFLHSKDSQEFTDVNQLEPPLRAAAAANPEQAVIIVPADEVRDHDQLVPFFNVVAVMDVAKRAGIKTIKFQAPRQDVAPTASGG